MLHYQWPHFYIKQFMPSKIQLTTTKNLDQMGFHLMHVF